MIVRCHHKVRNLNDQTAEYLDFGCQPDKDLKIYQPLPVGWLLVAAVSLGRYLLMGTTGQTAI